MDGAFAICAATLRRVDPDRYLSALLAPAARRPFLFALYAFNHEIAHVGESVREAMVGEIRLQWWREALEGARRGEPRPHDTVRALAATFAEIALPAELFEAMIDARAFDFSGTTFADDAARDAYLDATSGNLMRLAARILGTGNKHDDLAREAGIAYGLVGLLRNRRLHASRGNILVANEAMAVGEARMRFARASALPKPGRGIAAFLPASLVPLYLRDPAKDVPIHRRQIALLGAALRGRI